MPVEHVNRCGDKYVLQAGKTKTGKPRYWFGRKLSGERVEVIPEGFEIHERPEDGQVFLRKKIPSAITPMEKELVAEGIRRLAEIQHFLIHQQGNSLVVYLPDRDPAGVSRIFREIFGATEAVAAEMQQWSLAHTSYSKMMRFTLIDEESRLFSAERWCFRGSIDDWIPLGKRAPLDFLVEHYAPHLGNESFYDLLPGF